MSRLRSKKPNKKLRKSHLDASRKLTKDQMREIKLNADYSRSVHVENEEFTNYLNKSNRNIFEEFLYEFSTDYERVYEYSYSDETKNIEKNIKDIVSEYFDLSSYEVDFMMKARWLTSFNGEPTSFRLYFNLDEKDDKYELILFDPFHLAIKSERQRAENTYAINHNNNICISDCIKEVKSSYPMSKSLLKTIDL